MTHDTPPQFYCHTCDHPVQPKDVVDGKHRTFVRVGMYVEEVWHEVRLKPRRTSKRKSALERMADRKEE